MKNITDILNRLEKLHPKAIDLSLSRIKKLLDKLGNPEKKLPPTIHVAGTNAKGSTLAFLREIYEKNGYKVCAYSSPHLINFNERIYLEGQNIKNDELIELIDYVEKINQNNPITFFEITTVVAFLAFAKRNSDILLLETGLGGMLDATNVIESPVACVLTPISKDHENFLGSDVKKIAFEKANIIKKQSNVIIGQQTKEVLSVILDYAKKQNAKTYIFDKDWSYNINNDKSFDFSNKRDCKKYNQPSLFGEHQYHNASLALATIEFINKEKFDYEKTKKAISNTFWPARMQKITTGKIKNILSDNYEIWLDGGHNENAGKAIGKILSNEFNDMPTDIITSILTTKDYKAYYGNFIDKTNHFITTKTKNSKASFDEKKLADSLKSEFNKEITAKETFQKALEKLEKNNQNKQQKKRLLICGSLYLAGEVLSFNDE